MDSGSANSAALARFGRNVCNLKSKDEKRTLAHHSHPWDIGKVQNPEIMRAFLTEYDEDVAMSLARW